MFNFRFSLRSLQKNKLYSFINISGLVVGMAGAGLILLWLSNEVSYDRFHINGDRIYQVYGMTDIPGEKHTAIEVVAQPLGPVLKQEFPEVEAMSREDDVAFLLRANGKSVISNHGIITDSDFLRIFSFPLVYGKPADQLRSAYSMVVTEKLAKNLFGTTDVIGKTVRVDSVDDFTITGVLKDLPVNSRFHYCEYLLPWEYMKKTGRVNNNWLSNNIFTYALLKPGTDAAAFNTKIRNLSKIMSGHSDIWIHFLYPMAKWHLYSEFDNGVPVGGRIDTVRMFGLIAAFILLIACINFMNLSTARSEKRAKEVGIRKVMGAVRLLLIGQFIAEAFLNVCIGGAIALGVVQLALPAFNSLLGQNLSIPFGSVGLWLSVAGFILFTSLLAGSYPAFYLSAFKPVGIFRRQFRKSQSVFSLRRILVVLQFCFAIVLIICTLIVRDQVLYIEGRDTGYSKNNLIYVNFAGDIPKNYELIRRELMASGIAESVTKTWTPITYGGGHTWAFRWLGMEPKDTNTAITIFSEDAALSKTVGMKIIAGRDIDVYRYPTDSFAVVLNETAVKKMRFAQPIGQILRTSSGKNWHVVGVVKDYVDAVPWEETPPVVIEGPASDFRAMHVKFGPGITTRQGLAKAEAVFRKYNPAYPFEFTFVDQEYASNFDDNQRTGKMVGVFAALAIFISCLGLFGLSAYVAESRVKEIGVRKVLGASVTDITGLLSKEFLRLVGISFVIASPIAWLVMHSWLANYSYRIAIEWWVFALTGLLSLFIALATVSFQAVGAALANPIRNLRTE